MALRTRKAPKFKVFQIARLASMISMKLASNFSHY